VEKKINGGWKSLYALENNCREVEFQLWEEHKFLFDTLVILVIMYGY
jgi:hypothetical protein